VKCSAPDCDEEAVGQCASCDRWRCDEHRSFSSYADEYFCNPDMDIARRYWQTECAP